jgi:hypothetical protein
MSKGSFERESKSQLSSCRPGNLWIETDGVLETSSNEDEGSWLSKDWETAFRKRGALVEAVGVGDAGSGLHGALCAR